MDPWALLDRLAARTLRTIRCDHREKAWKTWLGLRDQRRDGCDPEEVLRALHPGMQRDTDPLRWRRRRDALAQRRRRWLARMDAVVARMRVTGAWDPDDDATWETARVLLRGLDEADAVEAGPVSRFAVG
jgi:hypothetical protein